MITYQEILKKEGVPEDQLPEKAKRKIERIKKLGLVIKMQEGILTNNPDNQAAKTTIKNTTNEIEDLHDDINGIIAGIVAERDSDKEANEKKKQQYDQSIKDAIVAETEDRLQDALGLYQKAIELMPGDPAATEKIKALQEFLAKPKEEDWKPFWRRRRS